MPTLSKHTALVNFDPTNVLSPSVEPIACSVTVNEAWSPYVTASVVLPTSSVPATVDPRNATYVGLVLQQDFGDLVYNYELTASFGGSVSAFTAQYFTLYSTNYVTNPNFETNLTGWSATGTPAAVITRTNTQSFFYSYSMSVACDGTAANQGAFLNPRAEIIADQAYTASMYVKATAGTSIRIELGEWTTGGVQVGTRSLGTTTTATGAWQRLSVSRTMGATGTRADIIIRNLNAVANTIYVDGVMLQPGSTLNTFFDGSTTDSLTTHFSWTGTANGSTSIRYEPIYLNEITKDYTKSWNIYEAGLPLSKVTTTYTPVTPLKLTNAYLPYVWKMTDFLHSSGTYNPTPSTIFNGYLMLRSIQRNYLTGESTLELTSHEAILQESVGYTTAVVYTSSSLKDIINYVLHTAIGIFVSLEPGAADYTYSTPYGLKWAPNQTGWDVLNALVTAADRVLYCDEAGNWYLKNAGSVTGTLALSDTDNITTLTSTIDRNNANFFDYAIVEYRDTATGVSTYDSFGTSGFDISKDRYFIRENVAYPGAGAAQAMVWRAVTRGYLYQVEAISNYDARPRQTMTIDITGEALKTATIQSVTWQLPSARMSIDIRDLT